LVIPCIHVARPQCEEPDALIAHVRICGGRGKATSLVYPTEILKAKNYVRESKWSQSIAVGSKSFVEVIKEKLGIRAKGRKVGRSGELYHLREAQVPYDSDFTPENSDLKAINTYIWSDNP